MVHTQKTRESFAYMENPLESKELTFWKNWVALYSAGLFPSHLKPICSKAFKDTIVQSLENQNPDTNIKNGKSLFPVIIYTSNDAVVSITDAVHQ